MFKGIHLANLKYYSEIIVQLRDTPRHCTLQCFHKATKIFLIIGITATKIKLRAGSGGADLNFGVWVRTISNLKDWLAYSMSSRAS